MNDEEVLIDVLERIAEALERIVEIIETASRNEQDS